MYQNDVTADARLIAGQARQEGHHSTVTDPLCIICWLFKSRFATSRRSHYLVQLGSQLVKFTYCLRKTITYHDTTPASRCTKRNSKIAKILSISLSVPYTTDSDEEPYKLYQKV